jgi:hypothetical protein
MWCCRQVAGLSGLKVRFSAGSISVYRRFPFAVYLRCFTGRLAEKALTFGYFNNFATISQLQGILR